MTAPAPGGSALTMRGSITIATIFGTKIRMHFTFLLLLLWVAAGEGMTRGAGAAISGLIFVLILFVCVVAHELGHVLVARHYGGRTQDILLLPMGGVSRMEQMPKSSAQELAVAIAGPAVSIAVGLALSLFAGFPTVQSIDSPAFTAILPRLAATNLFLALFNLLPAFPMDGGRVLRALLAMRMGRVRGTKIAVQMGHLFSGLFVLVGLFSGNPILLLIGLFIYFGASAEGADTELRQIAETLLVADVMRSKLSTIDSRASLRDAIELMLHAGQHAVPVIGQDGTVSGVVTKESAIRAVHHSGQGALLGEAIERNVPTVTSSKRLSDVVELMQTSPALILVTDPGGELSGLVTAETLADLVLFGPGAQLHGERAARAVPRGFTISVPKSA